jgi:hypothetical protein
MTNEQSNLVEILYAEANGISETQGLGWFSISRGDEVMLKMVVNTLGGRTVYKPGLRERLVVPLADLKIFNSPGVKSSVTYRDIESGKAFSNGIPLYDC